MVVSGRKGAGQDDILAAIEGTSVELAALAVAIAATNTKLDTIAARLPAELHANSGLKTASLPLI